MLSEYEDMESFRQHVDVEGAASQLESAMGTLEAYCE